MDAYRHEYSENETMEQKGCHGESAPSPRATEMISAGLIGCSVSLQWAIHPPSRPLHREVVHFWANPRSQYNRNSINACAWREFL